MYYNADEDYYVCPRGQHLEHIGDEYREKAKERLTSEEGLYHRSMRPVEPEAVFGDIKYDHGFIGLVALAHNLRKYARVQTLELPITSEPVVAELPKTHEKVAA